MRRGVLVVEDEAIVAEAIREALSTLGYPVTGVVHSGEDAVQHAIEHHPDLVPVAALREDRFARLVQ